MQLLTRLVAAAGTTPFAVIRREGRNEVDVLTGETTVVDVLASIPLHGETVLTLVPFRQVSERGYPVHDDHAPLHCLTVHQHDVVALADVLDTLPHQSATLTDHNFDLTDDEYAQQVSSIIDDEIGSGEGANFVLCRSFTARTNSEPTLAALGWLREILIHETGAYWTFAVHIPAHDGHPAVTCVGATPERHVSVRDGEAMMNPISGTYRHPRHTPTDDKLIEFLSDDKENDELFMVVDEEMKMMSAICPSGGRILGPFLKRMSRLTHTEYLLVGRTELDARDVLRLTMFAPTVAGSPIRNACAVIRRHEQRARGYYAGVLGLFEPRTDGTYELDAPILIRTAFIDSAGGVRLPVGATIVRSSKPEDEVAETRVKAAGMLAALGVEDHPVPRTAAVAPSEQVAAALARRNGSLAEFWLRPQLPEVDRTLAGVSALLVDNEDDFTTMLAHQLRHLGMTVEIRPWTQMGSTLDNSEQLVVFGPGPGNPTDSADSRMRRLRSLIESRLDGGPFLAVCLSHQMLSIVAGLPVSRLPHPHQGVRLGVDIFGQQAHIGFYNTFAARTEPGARRTPQLDFEISADPTGVVDALRRPGAASVQGHLESVLSSDGLDVLGRLLRGTIPSLSTPR